MIFILIQILLIVVAGITKSIQDILCFHADSSIFPTNWWPNNSWTNKYKNGNPNDGPAFLFSTTIFVFLTDPWHFFGFIRTIAWLSFVGFYAYQPLFNLTHVLLNILTLIGVWILHNLTFQIFFSKIFAKKSN